MLTQIASQLTLDEKRRLVGELKAAIAEELAAGAGADPERCPRCGCPTFVRKGRDRDGAQRWLCRGCAQTFSAKTGSLLALSKLPPAAWMEFAECMADRLPLRETARRCGVSLYTSWFMRMRVCEVMASRTPEPRLGTFHVDAMLVRENLSGNLGRSRRGLPRGRHRNGRDGRSKARMERIAVVCGVNELGDCFCDASSRGAETSAGVLSSMCGRVPAGCTVVSDGSKSYTLHGAFSWRHVAVDPDDPSTGDINMVNALHSRLRGFLAPFHGVATRRLQRYLDWFRWIEQYKRSDMDRRELLFGQEVSGTYVMTRRFTHFETSRFWWYWASQQPYVNAGLT
jgi:transposase-like protein